LGYSKGNLFLRSELETIKALQLMKKLQECLPDIPANVSEQQWKPIPARDTGSSASETSGWKRNDGYRYTSKQGGEALLHLGGKEGSESKNKGENTWDQKASAEDVEVLSSYPKKGGGPRLSQGTEE